MDGISATIEFNCGEVVTGVAYVDMALEAHSKKCNCEQE